KASELALKTDSLFDHLWIDLNKVDTLIRLGRFDDARESLLNLVSTTREHQFKWLTAKALSIYGYTVRLTDSYGEMLNLLSEADRAFLDIDAPHDRIRVLYSLAGYRYLGGDQDEALRLALECLSLVPEGNEATRISTLDSLISSIL